MSERAIYEQFRLTPEGRALLEVIKYAEGTQGPKSYTTLFGGGQFTDLRRHPNRVISSDSGYRSTAAGAYQFKTPTWDEVSEKLGLKDFGPLSQDLAALERARKRLMSLGGLSYLQQKGLTREALAALSPEWASLPTLEGRSYYGQPVKSASELQKVYQEYFNRPTVPQGTQASPQAGTQAAGETKPKPSETSAAKPNQNYFRNTMAAVQNMFKPSTTSSSDADKYFDAALQYDAAGDSDTALALYEKALSSDLGGSSSASSSSDFFASMVPAVIADYVTAAAEEAQRNAVPPAAPPAATQPTSTAATSSAGGTLGIVDLGRRLEGAGLRVREHPAFGGVGGHTPGSLHYKGLALDITDWQDPGESRASWLPRKTYLARQFSNILGSNAQIFGPHNDPKDHGEHIHLGLPTGKISQEQAQRLVAARQEALKRYPLRWAD